MPAKRPAADGGDGGGDEPAPKRAAVVSGDARGGASGEETVHVAVVLEGGFSLSSFETYELRDLDSDAPRLLLDDTFTFVRKNRITEVIQEINSFRRKSNSLMKLRVI